MTDEGRKRRRVKPPPWPFTTYIALASAVVTQPFEPALTRIPVGYVVTDVVECAYPGYRRVRASIARDGKDGIRFTNAEPLSAPPGVTRPGWLALFDQQQDGHMLMWATLLEEWWVLMIDGGIPAGGLECDMMGEDGVWP